MSLPKKNLLVGKDNKNALFFYTLARAKAKEINLLTSKNGTLFNPEPEEIIIKKGKLKRKESLSRGKNFKFTAFKKDRFFLNYEKNNKIYSAVSSKINSWDVLGVCHGIAEPGHLVPDFLFDKEYCLYYTNRGNIKAAYSSDLLNWKNVRTNIIKPRKSYFDNNKLSVGNVFLNKEGITLFYYHRDKKGLYSIGMAVLHPDNPEQIIWRTDKPLWKQPAKWKKEKLNPLGIVNIKNQFISYWENSKGELFFVELPDVWYIEEYNDENIPKELYPVLERLEVNPIISPDPDSDWENDCAFNPTAFREGDTTYIIYRAIGSDNISVLGCATSKDGAIINEKFKQPIYVPRETFEGGGKYVDPKNVVAYRSGGGWGGCEDPKVTKIKDKLYLTYVGFDGNHPPRIAISSITIKDFLARKWENWKKPILISPPGVIDKSGVIMPEKIKGKFVIFHRIYPNILIDFVDSLDDFDGQTKFLEGQYKIEPRPLLWDSRKVSIASHPIITDKGWLTIYHGLGNQDPLKYKIGAMLLDLNDPTKVLYRSNQPILDPVTAYENDGHKFGVAYPGGATVHDGHIYVYYGGSDKFTCVARAPLDDFMEKLINSDSPKLNEKICIKEK